MAIVRAARGASIDLPDDEGIETDLGPKGDTITDFPATIDLPDDEGIEAEIDGRRLAYNNKSILELFFDASSFRLAANAPGVSVL